MEPCNPAATAGKLRKSHLDEQHAHGHRKSAVWNRKRVNRMNFDEVPEKTSTTNALNLLKKGGPEPVEARTASLHDA